MASETVFAVRALGPADVDAFMKARAEALADSPLAFGASPEDDRGVSRSHMTRSLSDPGQAVFGAFARGELAGIVGVTRATGPKRAHKAYVWGMWVRPEARGLGIGRRLLEEAVAFARDLDGVSQLRLSVSEVASAAYSLYESTGFRRWGTEPEALRADGRTVVEYHMALDLASHI